jgi:hypothetical protein
MTDAATARTGTSRLTGFHSPIAPPQGLITSQMRRLSGFPSGADARALRFQKTITPLTERPVVIKPIRARADIRSASTDLAADAAQTSLTNARERRSAVARVSCRKASTSPALRLSRLRQSWKSNGIDGSKRRTVSRS